MTKRGKMKTSTIKAYVYKNSRNIVLLTKRKSLNENGVIFSGIKRNHSHFLEMYTLNEYLEMKTNKENS